MKKKRRRSRKYVYREPTILEIWWREGEAHRALPEAIRTREFICARYKAWYERQGMRFPKDFERRLPSLPRPLRGSEYSYV